MPARKTYESWGRCPRAPHQAVLPVHWRDAPPALDALGAPVLPYGQGRSYGDVCLNEGGILLDTAPLDRYIRFDRENGLLRCEGGVTLSDILDLVVPHGWFLPVTPGTRFVSVGGAIANDVHGKNHHRDGTFGCHVTRFELLRSTGERLVCSPEENTELFKATIGGLGLTGLLLWAEFRLKRIPGPAIAMDAVRFAALEEFFPLSEAANDRFDYIVSWVDCTARGRHLGRGVFMPGNFTPADKPPAAGTLRATVPFDAPEFALNPLTVRAFNEVYFRARPARVTGKVVHYESFFYPLDAVHHWNRMYGRRGLLQWQCVVPYADGYGAIREILAQIAGSGRASFLAVLKTFGDIASPGMLSFPRPGVTLALDFPVHDETLRLMDRLDAVVLEAGGVLYPAKDARMAPETFTACFPQWEHFATFIDPAFSSSFWRRVTARKSAPAARTAESLAIAA